MRNCFHRGGRFDEVYAGLTREFGRKGITRLWPSTIQPISNCVYVFVYVCVYVRMYRMILMMMRE